MSVLPVFPSEVRVTSYSMNIEFCIKHLSSDFSEISHFPNYNVILFAKVILPPFHYHAVQDKFWLFSSTGNYTLFILIVFGRDMVALEIHLRISVKLIYFTVRFRFNAQF